VSDPEPPLVPKRKERKVYSVRDFLGGVKALIEDRVGRIYVSGETSNVHLAPSGHYYFTLKDSAGQIRCACFRGDASRLKFELENGLDVIVHAEASIYEQRGELQLIVRAVEPRGEGALQLAFEQLRKRLQAEGLFDPARKQPIPTHPRRIAIVTSPTGAAIRDVIQVSGRRSPSTPLVVSPTRVQGDGVELEIAAAIVRAAKLPGVDLILVVRGGGSLEDLWCFNTEPVVRAIANCAIPVISGVGHETDFTLSDLAADMRAPTPSAAAMAALPDRAALRSDLISFWRRLVSAGYDAAEMRREQLGQAQRSLRMLAPSARLRAQRQELQAAMRALLLAGRAVGADARRQVARSIERLAVRTPRTDLARSRLVAANASLSRSLARGTQQHTAKLGALAAQLDSLSPLAVLGRGFAVARRASDGAIVSGPEDVAVGDELEIRVARATIGARVETVRDDDSHEN
jgi:exodeoxyribonuclease VII large subunit